MLNPSTVPARVDLAQLLGSFQQALLEDDDAVPTALAAQLAQGHVPGFGMAERLQIYRHAYRARMVEALRDSFGHSARYLDAQFDGKVASAFERLAHAFLRTHASTARSIHAYGGEWPEWLAEHLVRWPEVAELARLDWSLRRAFDGPDAKALTMADLAARVAQPGWEGQALHPVPTFRSLRFGTNALALWHAIDQDAAPPAAALLAEASTVIVWRVGEQPHFRSVDSFEASALQHLCAHGSFGALCDALQARHIAGDAGASFDVAASAGALLGRWVEEALLAA